MTAVLLPHVKTFLMKILSEPKYPNHSIFYNKFYISCQTMLFLLKHGLHK